MKKFSERIGLVHAKDSVQLESMDDDLRNGLWNMFQVYYLNEVNAQYINQSGFNEFFINLWHHFFKLPIDTLDNWYGSTRVTLREWFFAWEWYEVYDFIEFVSNIGLTATDDQGFRDACDEVLQTELSGYRFIGKIISPITNSTELKEIDAAIDSASNNHNLIGVKTHLESALKKLSDRNSPDYRNSIKESISAVESISKIISNNSKDSLGAALDKIKGKINLHPSLEKGFKQIYGYTSDADGIRHALTEQSTCDFEDAKYMLVSSSAFVNYLITKANKASIEI